MPRIELDIECTACKATGLYVGMAERDGIAVQCYRCKGTGCEKYRMEYAEFKGRKPRSDVLRVLQTNPGIGCGVSAERGLTRESFGGMPFADWDAGKPFPPKSEMRQFTCPTWWYQFADYNQKPDWDECDDSFGSTFSRCPHFATKEKCWQRFDKERLRVET